MTELTDRSRLSLASADVQVPAPPFRPSPEYTREPRSVGRAVHWIAVRALVAVVLLLTTAAAPLPPEMERIFGSDRIDTAVVVSSAYWDTADVALLATARDYPDALTAAALAADLDAPLLLTEPDTLPGVVDDELERLGVSEVIVLGGPAAVSDEVVAAVTDDGIAVRRIAGADRYETAAEIAATFDETDTVVVASGRDFPDALSTSTLSTQLGWPVLLVGVDHLPAATVTALEALDVREVKVVGGPVAVSDAVFDRLAEIADVERIAGADRYGTSLAVLDEALGRLEPEDRCLLVASGVDYPDALVAAGLAPRVNGLVMLTDAETFPVWDPELFAGERRLSGGLTVGGPTAIHDRVLWALQPAFGGTHCTPEELGS